MNIQLFDKVARASYVFKNKDYKNIQANSEDETVELDKSTILLGYGATYTHDVYSSQKKEFMGVVVGIYSIGTKRQFTENYNDYYNKPEILTEMKDFIKVAKIYYGNNKSRIVPLKNITKVLGG